MPDNLTPAEYTTIGYTDSEVELPPGQIFNGIFVQQNFKLGVFE